MSDDMSDDNGFLTARARMTMGTKVSLHVEGTAIGYSSDATAQAEHEPGDFNPRIWGVRVTVTEGSGPMKGHAVPWSRDFVLPSADYDQVRVSAGEQTITVDILNDRP